MTKKIVIIGCGSLGSFFSYLLVKKIKEGEIILIDNDIIEGKNVENQIYHLEDIGKSKVDVLKEKLEKIKKEKVKIKKIKKRFPFKNLEKEIENAEIVIDCTDSLHHLSFLEDLLKKKKVKKIGFVKVDSFTGMFCISSSLQGFKEVMRIIEKRKNKKIDERGRLETVLYVLSSFLFFLSSHFTSFQSRTILVFESLITGKREIIYFPSSFLSSPTNQ